MMANRTYYTVGNRVVWCDGAGRMWHGEATADRLAKLTARGYVRVPRVWGIG